MIKKILTLIFLSVCFFQFDSNVKAESNFQTDINVEYKVLVSGKTTVTNTISIKNLKSDYFPQRYVLNLRGLNPQNIKAYESGTLLKTSLDIVSEETQLIVDFTNLSVGKGTKKTFIVTFEDSTLTKKTGEIWEVLLPKINDKENYQTYKVSLLVPDELGSEAYISPEPTSENRIENGTIYKYVDYHNLNSGVTAGFGIFQVFAFDINYHLDGQNEGYSEVALPPDTSTQRVFYENIAPEPLDVVLDSDGNWLAQYDLKAGKSLDIKIKGHVQIFAKPNNLTGVAALTNAHDTQPTAYWQSDDPSIKTVASSLNGIQGIYNFVVETLNYNNERMGDNYERFGAVKALTNPNDALCMEFTDLFIALARAKGIPAREINGFAYTQNSKLEPISLVTDVIHSWPEYWDEENKIWIPVDPTWGKTTGGVDFFNKFDLRHFAFVIHSKNPVLPYSAGIYKNSNNPKKDISVSFSRLPQRMVPNIQINSSNSYLIPFVLSKIGVTVTNYGPNALYNFPVSSLVNGKLNKSIFVSFLPFSHQKFSYNLNYGLLASKSTEYIVFSAGDISHNIPINKEVIVIGQLGLFMLLLFVLLLVFHYMNHRQLYKGLTEKLMASCRLYVKKIFTSSSH